MKKLIALLLAMFMVLMLVPAAFGEAAEEAADEATESQETESKVEQIMLKKGSAIIKEFVECKKVSTGSYSSIKFQTAVITDVETELKYYGIRIEFPYYNSKYDSGTAVALIDSDEIDSIISTLEYIKAHKAEFVNYTEVAYTTSGSFSIGAYKNASETGLFFKKGTKQDLVSIDYLDDFISAFREVQGKIGAN